MVADEAARGSDDAVARKVQVIAGRGTPFDVRRFSVNEGMSSPFRVEIVAVCPDHDVEFRSVVGQPARFSLDVGARSRRWHGLCSRLELVGTSEEGLSTYELHVVPTLWLATHRSNYRVFQGMSELEVVLDVLRSCDIDPILRVNPARHRKREYRVQYGETDYGFVCRMLEDAGICFFFEEEDDRTRVVLSDAPHLARPRESLRHRPTADDAKLGDAVMTAVRLADEVASTHYTIRDHDFRRPATTVISGEAEVRADGIQQSLEWYQFVPGALSFESAGGHPTPVADDRGRYRTDLDAGNALAERLLHATHGATPSCVFDTTATDLAPGDVVSVLDHPHSLLAREGALLVMSSSISGTHDGAWTHRCASRSTAGAYVPPRTSARPAASGVENAIVVGPVGEEIHVDEHGRVRVQFHWDRVGEMNERSSCWIHVSQPWAGAGYGVVSLPRVGQEVVVGFVRGNPDLPVIVGRVFTGIQSPTYRLPANKTRSGWRTCSSPGGGGYNELMMEDAAGHELVSLQAEKDHHVLVKNDEEVIVGNSRRAMVQNDETQSVGMNQRVSVGVNRTTHVGRSDRLQVGAQYKAEVVPPPGSRPPTVVTMVDEQIVLDTGAGARITLSGEEILIEAVKISVVGDKELLAKVQRGDLSLVGGPKVKVNC